MLKSVDRFRKNVIDRDIKRVYVLDSYYGRLVQNILTDMDVEIVTVRLNSNKLDSIDFGCEDAVVVFDTTVHRLNSYMADLVIHANRFAGLVSILTEDVWEYVPRDRNGEFVPCNIEKEIKVESTIKSLNRKEITGTALYSYLNNSICNKYPLTDLNSFARIVNSVIDAVEDSLKDGT